VRHSALFALLTASLVAACTTTAADDSPSARDDALAAFQADDRLGEEVTRVCFVGQIDGFTQTTDYSVVVEEGANDHFLLLTRNRCSDLDFAQSIKLDTFSSCLTRGDRIFPFDSAFGRNISGRPTLGCQVDRMFEWDPKAGGDGDGGEADGAPPGGDSETGETAAP